MIAQALLGTVLLVLLVLGLSAGVLWARSLLLPRRPVAVTVNRGSALQAMTGDRLLPVLTGGGIPIPAACGGKGTCGLCRVTVPEGGGAPLPTELARISPADIRGGTRLACQVVLRGPVAVGVPAEYLAAESYRCRVASTLMLAPLIREIVLDLPPGADFTMRAGAFVQIAAPPYALDFAALDVAPGFAAEWDRMGWRGLSVRNAEAAERAYSLANRPEDAGKVVLNVRLAVPPPGAERVPPGIVSSWLFSLKPGDAVEISGPFGDFGARDTGREMVFIGGGVGMAPLRAIIHDQLVRVGTARRMTYFYGARSGTDAFYAREFRALAERHPNFTFTIALSDPAPGEDGVFETGFVHEVARRAYLGGHPAPEGCEYYLCGPPLMIQAVRAMLEDLGVEDEAIFFDDFGS